MPGISDTHNEDALIIRVGPECYEYGDPYTWCCNVEDEGDGCCLVYGATRAPTSLEKRWTVEIAKQAGFTWVRWERMRDGRTHLTRYFKVR